MRQPRPKFNNFQILHSTRNAVENDTADSFVGLNIVAELVTTLMNCGVGCLPVSHWLARHCAIQNLVQKANQVEITSSCTKSAVSPSTIYSALFNHPDNFQARTLALSFQSTPTRVAVY